MSDPDCPDTLCHDARPLREVERLRSLARMMRALIQVRDYEAALLVSDAILLGRNLP